MARRAVVGFLSLAMVCIACSAPQRSLSTVTPRAAQQANVPSESDVLEAALPGVVLVVNERADGKIGFGSGILLDDKGRILTNLHVVANAQALRVLFYDKKRTSYIPADGGLGRYLFENERDRKDASLERADPAVDLAVIKVDADTSSYPRLPFRQETVRVGERVLALGHPNETVWSFSSGVVSSMHSAAVQTDAAINHGNSGGPLIDTRGRVIGVNTSKLFGDSEGVSFARPIALARELIDGVHAPFEPDLSSPDRAFMTCERAWELRSAAVADCLDDETTYEFMQATWARLETRLSLTPAQVRAMRERTERYGKAKWIEFHRKLVIASAKGEEIAPVIDETRKDLHEMAVEDGSGVRTGWDAHLERKEIVSRMRQALANVKAYEAMYDRRLLERTGMKLDRKNPNASRDLQKMGIRIERTVLLGDDRAWIAVEGRNLDDTRYRYAELWLRRGTAWHQKEVPTRADLKTLPKGFPALPSDYETELNNLTDQMVTNLKRPIASSKTR